MKMGWYRELKTHIGVLFLQSCSSVGIFNNNMQQLLSKTFGRSDKHLVPL